MSLVCTVPDHLDLHPYKVHPNTLNSFGVMEYTEKFVKKNKQKTLSKKCSFHQKMQFSPKNWEQTEKNMASHESRDPEETMCEI